jgi:hypothetical protein
MRTYPLHQLARELADSYAMSYAPKNDTDTPSYPS